MRKYKEQILKNSKQPNSKKSIWETIGDVIYLIIIIPLLIITLMVIYQSITKPDKIPDIFGYKLFMILDENMEETLEYGDLTFTCNISVDKLKIGDIVAFRNATNTVTIHRIEEISETEEHSKIFIMKAKENEAEDTRNVKEEKIEGILTKRIPKIGLWIMVFQEPLVTIAVIMIIAIIGLIAYYIAGRLDKKDIEKELYNKEQDNSNAKTEKIKALK